MTVTRIGVMKAKVGEEQALRNFFETVIMPALDRSAGMQSYHMLQNAVEPTRFIFIELWDSVQAHQASVNNIDSGQIETVMKLLAEKPWGEYYSDNGIA